MCGQENGGLVTTLLIPESADGNLRKGPTEIASIFGLNLTDDKRTSFSRELHQEILKYDAIYTSSRALLTAGIKDMQVTGRHKDQYIIVEDATNYLDESDISKLISEYKYLIFLTFDNDDDQHCVYELCRCLDEVYPLDNERFKAKIKASEEYVTRTCGFEITGCNNKMMVIQSYDYPDRSLIDTLEYLFKLRSLIYMGFTSGYKGYLVTHKMVDRFVFLVIPVIIGYTNSERAIVGLYESGVTGGDRCLYLTLEDVNRRPDGTLLLSYRVTQRP